MDTPVLVMLAVCALPCMLILLVGIYECVTYRAFKPKAKKSKALGSTKFTPSAVPADVDVIVIGSGQGGMSCASVLASFGKRVVVCEQHMVLGGGGHTFAVEGKSKYRFDAGHHLTIPMHQQILQLACGCSKPPVVFPSLKDDAGASDYVVLGDGADPKSRLPIGSAQELEALLKSKFPAHAEDVSKYMRLAESVQMRFAFYVAASILPIALRRLFLSSPLMSLWNLWSAQTSAGGSTLALAFTLTLTLTAHRAPRTAHRSPSSSPSPSPSPSPLAHRSPLPLHSSHITLTLALTHTHTLISHPHPHPSSSSSPSPSSRSAKTSAEGLDAVIPGAAEDAARLRSFATGLWIDTGSPPSRSSFFMQTAVFGGWQQVGIPCLHPLPPSPTSISYLHLLTPSPASISYLHLLPPSPTPISYPHLLLPRRP